MKSPIVVLLVLLSFSLSCSRQDGAAETRDCHESHRLQTQPE
jgi:hypothetical protein